MSKLLDRPLKAFTIFALLVLVCSIPVYYLVVDYIWLKELDEHNFIIKQRIQKQFKEQTVNQNELKSILKYWNVLQPGTELLLSTDDRDSIYTITKINDAHAEKEIDRFRGLATPISIQGEKYRLYIETNVEEVDETLLAIAVVTFFFFSVMVIGFIFLNRKIAVKVWLPFRQTLDSIQAFDLAKDKSIHLPNTNIEEFEELNRELHRLIQNNISVFNQQKVFIENASHELQTPLAVLKTKLEMLLQTDNLTEDQAKLINTVHISMGRINRINKNLLLLAKIENNQFLETEKIDIVAVLKENKEMLTDYIIAKKLAVKTELPVYFELVANKTLVEILLNNLLINAIVHSPLESEIFVCFEANELAVSNPALSPLNTDTIFKRFEIASDKGTSSGLGLAIIKEICHRYGWEIQYAFANKAHVFSISF